MLADRLALPNLPLALEEYLAAEKLPIPDLIHYWHTVRIRLNAVHDDLLVMPPTTVQALPPSEDADAPFGRYDCVLVKNPQPERIVSFDGDFNPAEFLF